MPYRPQLQGWGVNTLGGTGGTIRRVQNLNNSGTNSLRQSILNHNSAGGPSIIVFERSGTIALTSDFLTVTAPNLTIAGQSAPSPGIQLRGPYNLQITAGDVVVQHLRCRSGDDAGAPTGNNRNPILIWLGAQNVVIDHCTLNYGIDEQAAAWTAATNSITWWKCIISHPLHNSIHPEGPHSANTNMHNGNSHIAYIRCLMAHAEDRMGRFRGNGVGGAHALINNIIYNRGLAATWYSNQNANAVNLALIGNRYKSGANEDNSWSRFIRLENRPGGSEVYVVDNSLDLRVSGGSDHGILADQWGAVLMSNFGGQGDKIDVQPSWLYSPITILGNSEIDALVTSDVGAWPNERDPLESRAKDEYLNGTGAIIDAPGDVDGWMAAHYVENSQVFVEGPDVMQTLEDLAVALEPSTASPPAVLNFPPGLGLILG